VKITEDKKQAITRTNLPPRQERFCQLYASDQEFFANGTQSYIEAYDINTSRPGAYKSAQAAASRLLTNVVILERLNELMELRGLNTPFVDKQLEFLITQNVDFGSKIRAIQEYNQLQQRIQKAQTIIPIQLNFNKEWNETKEGLLKILRTCPKEWILELKKVLDERQNN
jgi:hypothetical protein